MFIDKNEKLLLRYTGTVPRANTTRSSSRVSVKVVGRATLQLTFGERDFDSKWKQPFDIYMSEYFEGGNVLRPERSLEMAHLKIFSI